MCDNNPACPLYRYLRDLEGGKDEFLSGISHDVLEIISDMVAYPPTSMQMHYLQLLLKELAQECPEIRQLIERDISNCSICATLKSVL